MQDASAPSLRDNGGTVAGHAENAVPAVRVDDLHKSFSTTPVLEGVSFDVSAGQVVAIAGASGSGKSTLLRCINLLEIPDRGTITIAGEQIRLGTVRGRTAALDPAQVDRIRSRIGMVFQNFNLWTHMTVLENLIEAPIQVQRRPRAEVVAEGMELLDKVGLADKCDVYPAFLSGGQQQRAGIARALAIKPDLLLFDEPTSALDPELVGEVLTVIRGLAREGRTMILVTHEMRFAADVSDRVIFLHAGRIEDDGPPSQVLRNPKSARCAAFISRYANDHSGTVP